MADTLPSSEANFHGLKVLAPGSDPVLDIFAVHGLNGHREQTWASWQNPSVNWLRDFLPADLPKARIMTWGYDGNTHNVDQVNCQSIYDLGKALVADLCLERQLTGTSQRPLIFVCHSLGGIIVKSALIHCRHASANALEQHSYLLTSTIGIIFMGTPHQGAEAAAIGSFVGKVASLFMKTNNRLVGALAQGSDLLREQLQEFAMISTGIFVKYAYETYRTPVFGGAGSILVVSIASAVVASANAESIAVNEDHIRMVKFPSRDDPGYKTISGHIRLMAKKAVEGINGQSEMSTSAISARPVSNAPHPCYKLPFPRNQKFCGRAGVLHDLQDKFFSQKLQRVAITGLGGIGKSQLALQLAYWVQDHHPDYSIFWLSALSSESFSQSCSDALDLLDTTGTYKNPGLELQRKLSSAQGWKWLLIIDNADDSETLFKSSGVSHILPNHRHGLILFTTRQYEVADALAGTDVVELLQMGHDDGCELLERIIPKALLESEESKDKLLERLCYHPLALTQAAAYMRSRKVSLLLYLELMDNSPKDLINLLSRNFNDDTRYSGSNNAVATTWLISFEQIHSEHPYASHLLQYFSVLEPKAIPHFLLPSSDTEGIVFALGILQSYAFVVQRSEEGLYDMHPLVHLAVTIWVHQRSKTAYVVDLAVELLLDNRPEMTEENLPQLRQFAPHAFRLIVNSGMSLTDQFAELIRELTTYLFFEGRVEDGISWLSWILQEGTGMTALAYTSLQYQLAKLYHAAGQWQNAIELFEQSIPTLRKAHPERGAALNVILATAYVNVGQVQKGIKLLEGYLTVTGEASGECPDPGAGSYAALALAYHAEGQSTKAIELLEQCTKVMSTATHDFMTSPSRSKALELLRLLEGTVKDLPEDDILVIGVQEQLGHTYLKEGHVDVALHKLQYVADLWIRFEIKNDAGKLQTTHDLAEAYLRAKQPHRALEVLLPIAENVDPLPLPEYNRLPLIQLLQAAHAMNEQAIRGEELSDIV